MPSDPTSVPTNITFPTPSGPDKTIYRVLSDEANGRVEGNPITTGSQIDGSQAIPFGFNLDSNGDGFSEVNKGEYLIGIYQQGGTNPIVERQVSLSGESYTDDYSTGTATATPTLPPTPGPGTPTWTPSPTLVPTSTPIPGATFTPTPTATATATAVPTPVVTLVAPSGGPEGTEVTIVGSNLGSCSVKINGTDQSLGVITQNDGLISFNIVSETYVFGQGFTTIKIENTSGSVEKDFVVYKYRDDISKDTAGWGIWDLVFDQTGNKVYAYDLSWNIIRDVSFPALTENNTSSTSLGLGYIGLHPGNNRLYLPTGTTACYFPIDFSSGPTSFPGAPFSGQGNGVTYNPLLPSKIFFVDDNGGSSSTVMQFDLDGSNPSTKINLSARPQDLISDEDGNFYVASSESDKITKYNSSGTYIAEWSQNNSNFLCSTKKNGKTAIFSDGDTGTGNAMESLFLVEGTTSTRMCDIILPTGWAPGGGDFSNNYLVYFADPPRRWEVFSF